MATRHWPILNETLLPDATGKASFDVLSGPNLSWRHGVLVLPDHTAKLGFWGAFPIPKNYIASPALRLVWATATVPGATQIRFEFDYRVVAGDDAESLDQSGVQESVAASDGLASAVYERMVTTLALTAGNFSGKAGESVQFYLKRDPTHADDNYSGSVLLLHALFEYADS